MGIERAYTPLVTLGKVGAFMIATLFVVPVFCGISRGYLLALEEPEARKVA